MFQFTADFFFLNAQPESCELSFIWSKVRTIAQEAAFQGALRHCSKELGGNVSKWDLGERGGTCNQTHILHKADASHEEQTAP